MRQRFWSVVLVWVWLAAAVATSAQAPLATGSISGRVTVRGEPSPLPVRRARVTLDGGGTRAVTDTDTDGRYQFAGLQAGSYHVTAEKSGYVTLTAGATRPFVRPAPTALKNGEAITLDIALPRGAALEGRLADGSGEPLENVLVAAVRLVTTSQGRRPTVVAQDWTDDLGRFRVHSLPAGAFLLEAGFPSTLSMGVTAIPGKPVEGLARTYYPGTASVSDAQPVRVGVGEERTSLDFEMQRVPVSRLTLRVVDTTGKPPSTTGCRVQPVGGPFRLDAGPYVPQRGNVCEFHALPPGDYWVMGAARLSPGGSAAYAVSRITASGDDLGEMVLRVERSADIAGTIEPDEPDVWEHPPTVRVLTHAVAYDLPSPDGLLDGLMARANDAATTTAGPDGRFSLASVFGPTVFRLAGLPPGWALSAVWLDDQEVTDRAADLSATEKTRRLKMIVTNRTGRLAGTIARQDREPLAPDARVVVFAADESRWAAPSRFVAVAVPESNGRFSLEGLLPASYLVAVADDLDDDFWQDPEVLRRLTGRATLVTLAAGDSMTVALTTGGLR